MGMVSTFVPVKKSSELDLAVSNIFTSLYTFKMPVLIFKIYCYVRCKGVKRDTCMSSVEKELSSEGKYESQVQFEV